MNIFVVEDEPWALAELVELLKIYEPEHRIYAYADGDDALSAAHTICPQLVLTDINMPGMDGLELIEELHRLDSTIKSMILSVHDQFEYARQGMKFGVFDYLLKPVKKDVLFNAVDKAIQHIEMDSKRTEEWMSGSIGQMLLTAEIPQYDILRAVNGRAYCMVLLVLETGSVLRGWKDTCIGMNDLKQQFGCKPSHEREFHCLDLDCRQRVILIPISEAVQPIRIRENLSPLFQQLQQLQRPAHMGFAVKSEFDSLYAIFSDLKQRMDENMKFGMPTFIVPGMKNHDAEIGDLWEKVRVMETYFKKGDMLKGHVILDQILGELSEKQITKRQLRLFVHDMLFSLKYNLLASRKGQVSINELQEDNRILNRFADYRELFEWLNETLVSLYCGLAVKDLNPKGLVPVLLQLIHKSYQDSISLQQFAADHHVSLGYLSRMFKSQTGTTFSDYIAAYRISKAKELLTSGVERLQEVSQLVGYEDSKYFSALFKKIVGVAPITYAKRHAVKTSSNNRKNSPH
ncbi:response regulator [Paenibacillus sp. LMG 31456]|uniref:Response regulator n=1 Tax=Paenibacillus foliorum TaxID=2654974 RepID=A0A972GM83_9BACL|nr:response regulator [Paenibacillus foliorum]NOU93304.1 response regulator [Paenibacillus foliorum]